MKVGRNDPCPCGSGKKYKQCCYGKEGPHTNPGGIFDELRKIMRDKEFGSLKEAQAFLDWHTGQKNRAPLDDFQGLSPKRCTAFFTFPSRPRTSSPSPSGLLFLLRCLS